MRLSHLTVALTAILFTTSGYAQVKKGGLFGFSRRDEQISAGLFPDSSAPPTASYSTVPVEPSYIAPSRPSNDSDTIFRGGSPDEVEAVSYVIEDGTRVEQEIKKNKKRGSFFSFGRKNNVETAEDVVLAPVPEPIPEPIPAAIETTVAPTSVTRVEAPQISNAQPEIEIVASPTPATMQNPIESNGVELVEDAVEEEKEKGGFFSFFSKKKDKEESPSEPVFENGVVTPAVPVAEAVETATPVIAAEPVVATPAGDGEMPDIPTFAGEVPRREKTEEKEDRESGFNPIKKIMPDRPEKQRKATEYQKIETIIADGEIVGEDEDMVESNVVTSGDGESAPPTIVDGVKTYSSWGDVEANAPSAADKILQQVR